jgi:glycosyltransferase involved in cell wall biosynthesis
MLPDVLSQSGGAIQRRIMELAVRQTRRGREVIVYSPSTADATVHHRGVVVRLLALGKGGLRDQWRYQRRVAALLADAPASPDVIHSHSTPELAWVCRGLHTPVVLSFDEFHFRRGRRTPLFPVVRACLDRFDRLLPVSAYCAAESTSYWKLPADPVTVVHNGVNLEQFRPDADAGARTRAAWGVQGPVALYVGRLNRQKGTDVLIEAARRLRASGAPLTVVAAGPLGQFSGPGAEPRWDRLLEEAGGLYLGPVPEADLPAVYNAASVFVMPTRHLEMFGMAVVEAQATGKPVIATDHGGLRETVCTSAGGMLVPPGDAEALARAVRQACEGGQTPGHAGAVREFAARFDWERVCDRLELVYEEVARTSHQARSSFSQRSVIA